MLDYVTFVSGVSDTAVRDNLLKKVNNDFTIAGKKICQEGDAPEPLTGRDCATAVYIIFMWKH